MRICKNLSSRLVHFIFQRRRSCTSYSFLHSTSFMHLITTDCKKLHHEEFLLQNHIYHVRNAFPFSDVPDDVIV